MLGRVLMIFEYLPYLAVLRSQSSLMYPSAFRMFVKVWGCVIPYYESQIDFLILICVIFLISLDYY